MFLLVVHIFVCLLLIGIILLQPGKSDMGIGFGSSSQSIFGSKGAGNFLTKVTSICAVVFLLTSFLLTKERISETEGSALDNVPVTETEAPKEKIEPKEGTEKK